MLRIPEVIAGVEDTATDWVQSQLNTFRVAIKNTTGATRDAYLRVQEQTAVPEAVTIMLRTNERAATRDASGGPLPRFARHLFSDADGLFPAQLNDWERAVLAAETARSSFVAWYRNPGSATPASLRIAYENDAKTWVSLQPDFIMVSRRSDGSLGASVVDPHGDHLADARAKLRALADYAERHGDAFVRIELVARVGDGSLRSLDLTEASVRDAVRAFEGGKVTALYESSTAKPYL